MYDIPRYKPAVRVSEFNSSRLSLFLKFPNPPKKSMYIWKCETCLWREYIWVRLIRFVCFVWYNVFYINQSHAYPSSGCFIQLFLHNVWYAKWIEQAKYTEEWKYAVRCVLGEIWTFVYISRCADDMNHLSYMQNIVEVLLYIVTIQECRCKSFPKKIHVHFEP